MDPGSVAGVALATVSLAIQLADGARKAFVVLEEAYHADETCASFAVRLAIEHADFEAWAEASGLNEAVDAPGQRTSDATSAGAGGSTQRFESFLQYSGPAITHILAEIHLLMTQLTQSESKYSSLLDVTVKDPVPQAGRADLDITEPIPVHSSAIAQVLKDRGSSVAIAAPRLSSKSANFSQPNTGPSKSRKASPLDIFKRLTKTTRTVFEHKRLRWVILDKKSCGEKILRLSQLNRSLQRSLNRAEARGNATVFQMMLLQLGSSHGMLQQLLAAVQLNTDQVTGRPGTLLSGATLVPSSMSDVSAREDMAFIKEASIFALAALELPSQLQESNVFKNLTYEKSAVSKSRTSAKVADNVCVWIEWKNYEDVNVNDRLCVDPGLVTRVDRLVALLQIPTKPKAFRVPPCLGRLVDEDYNRIGIVYQAPSGAQAQTPRSLLDCLDLPASSLSCRVQIARSLSQWLLHFHSVHWYHKGFQSSSVLFFTSHDSDEVGEAYITGFGYARTSGEGPITTKPPRGVDTNDYYVHPDYLGGRREEGYLQVYDIYSLGIVLIELAYWQPIHRIFESIAAEDEDSIAASSDIVRERVLKHTPKVLEIMRSHVGDRYTAAVEACLNGMEALRSNDAERSSIAEANAALLYDFNDAVINTLRSIDI